MLESKRLKRILIVIIIIIISSFTIIPNKIYSKSFLEKAGGIIIDTGMQFLIFVGDCVLNILQNNFISTEEVVIEAESKDFSEVTPISIIALIAGIIMIVVAVVVAIASFGTLSFASLTAIGTAIKIVGGVLLIGGGGVASAVWGTSEIIDGLKGKFDLPMIRYTPYEIFSNEVPVFDVNFINPMDAIQDSMPNVEPMLQALVDNKKVGEKEFVLCFDLGAGYGPTLENLQDPDEFFDEDGNKLDPKPTTNLFRDLNFNYNLAWKAKSPDADEDYEDWDKDWNLAEKFKDSDYDEDYIAFWYFDNDLYQLEWIDNTGWTDNDIIIHKYSNVSSLIGDIDTDTVIYKQYESSARILQKSIATWYKVLRRVALVGLLSVLVYVGIRIVLSAPSGKSKYKNMFLNWLVAVCILFVLHYIMVFIVTLSQNLTSLFTTTGEENILVKLPYNTSIDGQMLPGAEGDGEKATRDNPPVWSCSFTGYVRLLAGAYDSEEDQMGTMNLAYGLIYLVMVIYTCIFTFMYLRRVLYMAFLTMIAPLIAVTYPLDKLKDGKAQALGLWLREYIFNALIQPVHLILYVMVVSSVMEYVKEHPIYALISIGFILPAEKMVKNMFGFGGSQTLKNLADAAGGAAVMSAVNNLSGVGAKHSVPKTNDNSKVRTADEPNDVDLPEVDFSDDTENTQTEIRKNMNIPQIDLSPREEIQNVYKELKSQGLNDEETRLRLINMFGDNDIIDSIMGEEENQIRTPYQKTSNLNIPTINPMYDNTNNQNNIRNLNYKANNETNSRSFASKVSSGLLNVGRQYNRRAMKAKPLRTAGTFVAKAFGGATLGMLTLAAGVASGNVQDAIKFTSTGVAIGSKLGKNIGNNVMDETTFVKESFKQGYKGIEEYNNDQFDKNFIKSKDLVDLINDRELYPEMSGGPTKEIKRSRQILDQAKQYHKMGIVDKDHISACIKQGLSAEEGDYAIKLAKMMKTKKINTKAKKESLHQSYMNKMQQKGSEKVNKKAEEIWEVASNIRFK